MTPKAIASVLMLAGVGMVAGVGDACAAQSAVESGRAKAKQCVVCHGELGIAVLPNAPNLAGQPEAYVVEQLKAYRAGKRANEVMSVIAKPLTDADIAELAAWYAAIAVEVKPPK